MASIVKFMPIALAGTLLLVSCGNNETTETSTTDSVVAPAPSIALADVTPSPDFPGAKINIKKISAVDQGADSVKVSFEFLVQNYELKNQTADAANKLCNNSDKGQHIHFILDNKPYTALYEPKHEVVLAKNTEHTLLVFLSRSYHESIKNEGASDIAHFKVEANGKLSSPEKPKTPMVFYSRPKGDYIGKDTENLLFDFYVVNAGLSETGYKVKAEIKGEGLDTTIIVSNWKSQFLKNMPMGKPSIKLTLIDSAGNKVEGPETEVTREFNLSKEEPMIAK